MSLDRALFRLLHREEVRAAFFRGEPSALGSGLELSADDLEALASIDPRELDPVSAAIVEGVFERSHLGVGALGAIYPRTLEAWRRATGDEALEVLARRFVASPEYERAWDLPAGGTGPSIEEAFYRFVDRHGVGESAVRFREFGRAILAALSVDPEPSFTMPAELIRTANGRALIRDGDPPLLVARANGKLIAGEITPEVVAAIRGHGARSPVLDRALAELGL